MSKPPYRALRVVLGFLSLLLAIGGVIMIVSNKPLIMRMFMHPPESEISILLLAALKEMGGMVLMVSVMLFFASRDPERNVAIIDAHRGSMHPRTHAARFAVHGRRAEPLSGVFDLGPRAGAIGAGECSLLLAPARLTLATCGHF